MGIVTVDEKGNITSAGDVMPSRCWNDLGAWSQAFLLFVAFSIFTILFFPQVGDV